MTTPATTPTSNAPSERSGGPGGAGSDIDHLQVADGSFEAARVNVDEEEASVRVAVAKRERLLEGEMRVGMAGLGSRDARELGTLHQPSERRRGLAVS